jgi:hypothetical protein
MTTRSEMPRWAGVAAWCAGVMLLASGAAAQQPPGEPVPQRPGEQLAPAPPAPGTTKPAPVAPAPSATAARTFTGPFGLLFNTVRPEKALDFERLVAAVRAALETSTDPVLQAQAKGWRFFKAAEPGPNGSVLYVFVVDPTVPGEDYGLGRVLSQSSTDAAALQEIWKLYTSSVTGGGSILNLSPVPVPPPAAAPGAPGIIDPGLAPGSPSPTPSTPPTAPDPAAPARP